MFRVQPRPYPGVGLTRAINGGYIGLEDRIKHTEHALHVLGA